MPPPAQGIYRKAMRAHHAGDGETWVAGTVAATLDAAGHAPRTAHAILTPLRVSGAWGSHGAGIGHAGDPAPALDRDGSAGIAGQVGVRRLTPTECERLQGFPDHWTQGFADSVRYRMLGNAVPVATWILCRIATCATAHAPAPQPSRRPARPHPRVCAHHPPPGTPHPPAARPANPPRPAVAPPRPPDP